MDTSTNIPYIDNVVPMWGLPLYSAVREYNSVYFNYISAAGTVHVFTVGSELDVKNCEEGKV